MTTHFDQFTDARRLFLKGQGEVGPELARGREKVARAVGTDKVLITYHQESERQLMTAEYFKAVYYLQKILFLLSPNTCIQVFAASNDSVLVERLPDTDDFVKAKQLNMLFRERKQHLLTADDLAWLNQMIREITGNPEFQEMIKLLDHLGLLGGKDATPAELALPMNTVVVEGHPIMLETFKPIVTNADGMVVPRLNLDGLASYIQNKLQSGELDQSTAQQVIALSKRYVANATKAAAHALSLNLTVY